METTLEDKKKKKIKNPLWARIVIGTLLLLLLTGCAYGIYATIRFPLTDSGTATGGVPVSQLNEALIMLFAGGLGSGLYSIRAYLLHACTLKDLDPDFLPWYPFWMVLGGLLSLVFYFALRGGLLFLTINNNQTAIESLNSWSLAAIGSLVGLFSKYALEKLRAIFLTIFGETSDGAAAKATTPQPVGAATPAPVVPIVSGGNGKGDL